MKIGLLLGSFNPITIAHVAMASNVLSSGVCDKVLFVVAKHNPWKKERPAPFEVRCEMVRMAIRPFGHRCEVCRFEEEFEPPVYSYLPINKAIETFPNDKIYLIAGTDTIGCVPMWKNFETDIKGKIGFVEVVRGNKCDEHGGLYGTVIPFRASFWTKDETLGGEKITLDIQRMDISSSMVRWMIEHNMNPCPYITEEIYNVIEKHKLYR